MKDQADNKSNLSNSNGSSIENQKKKITQHFRLDSTIYDFQFEISPVIVWISPDYEATPDLTELVYQNSFPN